MYIYIYIFFYYIYIYIYIYFFFLLYIFLKIPILAGTVLQYKYIDIESDEKCAPESLFEIPSDYQYDANLSFKFLK